MFNKMIIFFYFYSFIFLLKSSTRLILSDLPFYLRRRLSPWNILTKNLSHETIETNQIKAVYDVYEQVLIYKIFNVRDIYIQSNETNILIQSGRRNILKIYIPATSGLNLILFCLSIFFLITLNKPISGVLVRIILSAMWVACYGRVWGLKGEC